MPSLTRTTAPPPPPFSSRLDGSGIFQRQADLGRVEDIATWIDSGRALLVIQIDQDFERRLLAGEPAPIEVIADGRNSNTAGTALGYFGSVVDELQRRLAVQTTASPARPSGSSPARGTIPTSIRAGA